MEQATASIECEDFYNLCQAYRHSPMTDPMAVVKAYQALIDYIDQRAVNQHEGLKAALKELCLVAEEYRDNVIDADISSKAIDEALYKALKALEG